MMDGHLSKTLGGKKGQIRPMVRFRSSSAAQVTAGRVNRSVQLYFLEARFWIASGLPTTRPEPGVG